MRITILITILILSISIASHNQADSLNQENKSVKQCSISGRVTVHGEPASGVRVVLTLNPVFGFGEPVTETYTDENGQYRFNGLKSKHYWVKVVAPELVTVGLSLAKGLKRKASVADGESVDNVHFDLVRGGVISGRVSERNGKSVVNERVLVFAAGESGISVAPLYLEQSEVLTDSNGEYRILGMPQGNYIVGVGVNVALESGEIYSMYDYFSRGRIDQPEYYIQTYSPNVTEQPKARVSEITNGGEIRDVNIVLGSKKRTYKMTGRVIDAQTGKPLGNCNIGLGLRIRGGRRSYSPTQMRAGEDGQFQIDGLLSGKFFVNANFEDDRNFYSPVVEFEIRDNDVDGLVIKAYRGLSLSGSVVLDGVLDPDALAKMLDLKLYVSLSSWNDKNVFINKTVTVGVDGSFTIEGLHPGEAMLDLRSSSSADQYFSILGIEHKEIRKVWRERFVILSRENLTGVRIIVGYKNGTLKGRVKVAEGKLPTDLRVSVSWGEDANGGHATTMPNLDPNGNFKLDLLRPGLYKVDVSDGSGKIRQSSSVEVANNKIIDVEFIWPPGSIDKKDR